MLQSQNRLELLQARAHAMRFAPTWEEAKLWECLRARKLGVAFRRQQVIGNYIVDFLCSAQKLVIEVDGDAYHAQRISADAARDRRLGRAGFTVVHLPASLVKADLAAAVARVQAALR
jgi:very-short-patch-repair endonuclease